MELVGLSMKIVDYFFFKIHFPYCSVSHGGNIFCPGLGVPREMDGFMQWFQNTAPDGSNPLPALTRAGMAHLYFVCIHPLKDGNGRIGRAIAEKALAQSFGQPTLIAFNPTPSRSTKRLIMKHWSIIIKELRLQIGCYTSPKKSCKRSSVRKA